MTPGLIDALNCLMTQPGLVLSLIEQREVNKLGKYAIWLNLNAIWTRVVVDDYIPIIDDPKDKNGYRMAFTPLKNSQNPKIEIWQILIEKAIAKAYGGYQQLLIESQDDCDTYLKDMVGVAPTTLELKKL